MFPPSAIGSHGQMAKTFVNTALITLVITTSLTYSSPIVLNREGSYELSSGFLKALADLERLQEENNSPAYYYYEDYPVYETPAVDYPTEQYADWSEEQPQYIVEEAGDEDGEGEGEGVFDPEAVEEELAGLLEQMNSEEVDQFSDWLVEPGNEAYLMTFLQLLDNQLVDKYNEDVREEREILGVLDQVETLAAEVQQDTSASEDAAEMAAEQAAAAKQANQQQSAFWPSVSSPYQGLPMMMESKRGLQLDDSVAPYVLVQQRPSRRSFILNREDAINAMRRRGAAYYPTW